MGPRDAIINKLKAAITSLKSRPLLDRLRNLFRTRQKREEIRIKKQKNIDKLQSYIDRLNGIGFVLDVKQSQALIQTLKSATGPRSLMDRLNQFESAQKEEQLKVVIKTLGQLKTAAQAHLMHPASPYAKIKQKENQFYQERKELVDEMSQENRDIANDVKKSQSK